MFLGVGRKWVLLMVKGWWFFYRGGSGLFELWFRGCGLFRYFLGEFRLLEVVVCWWDVVDGDGGGSVGFWVY